MKKKSGSRIGRLFKGIFNVRSWSNYDQMKTFSVYIGQTIKKMFVPQQKQATESFAMAVKKLNLTDDQLKTKEFSLKRLAVIMSLVALCLTGYAAYHILYGTYRAMLVSLVLAALSLVLAFRYHFWYFQIKQRKLGCTIQEWYRQGLLGEKND